MSLYFASEWPVITRDERLIVIDDDRYPLAPGESPRLMRVALSLPRLLSPHGGPIPSTAMNIRDICNELWTTRRSVRAEACGFLCHEA
jgi:sulfate adenylyltransferase subunit 2